MAFLKEICNSLLHFLYPHVCSGCGGDLLDMGTLLCMKCMASMPETNFEKHAANPVEKIFWGRIPLVNATAQYYFTKSSLLQHLMHALKYKGEKELGVQLGQMMGEQLLRAGRFEVDALVPLPLFPAREKKRGYNQATVLCDGMSSILDIPVWDKIITRPHHTETQTKKGRIARWKNIDGKFVLKNADAITGKHLLLVDDVITTGATLEACGHELLKGDDVRLSIASLCMTSLI